MKNILSSIFHLLSGIVLVAMTLVGFTPVASATNDQICTAPLDVVLVFDRSDSMAYDHDEPPFQPLSNAQAGTQAFIDFLDPQNDKVGLVDFYEFAETTHSLTSDFDAVRSSVDEDWVDGWTNTSAAIDAAKAELNSNGRADVKQVMIILSDGNPSFPQPSPYAITLAKESAQAAKASGITIYTIGFGSDVNAQLMQEIASDPSYYHYVPTSAGIESAYMALAQTACEPEPEPEPVYGSINICKMIVDENGMIVDGNVNDGSFSVSGVEVTSHPTVPDSIDVLSTTHFDTPLSYNTTLFGNDGHNAECIAYENLELGDYFYAQEVIVGENWQAPLYNDQNNTEMQSVQDAFPFSGELFTEDGGADDSQRNTDADGHIILTENRPDRTLVIVNTYEIPEVPQAPYCGDGMVNQAWEQCDAGDDPQQVGCSAQCQHMGAPVCTDDVFARVVVTDVQNNKAKADMTDSIYLGSKTNAIPQGTWFPVHYDGVYVNDADIDGYEDVSGLAVQRIDGEIIARIHGSHEKDGTWEHVEGYIEFYNSKAKEIANDDTPKQNQMENWGLDMFAQKQIKAGKDAAWISDPVSHFWMTVTVADDSYRTSYDVPVCHVEENTAPQINGADSPLVIYVGETGNLTTIALAGVTANDAEDGDITGDIVIDGIDAIDVSAPNTTTITYRVEDSGAPTGDVLTDSVEREVQVKQMGDENNPPVITLTQGPEVTLTVGEIFDPLAYATVSDPDGDDTTLEYDGAVDTATVGTYTVVYTAYDENGAYAVPKTLTVTVEAAGICENIVVVSNTDDMIVGHGNAVETYDESHEWTAVIDAAKWIWKSYLVEQPAASETYTFTKDFVYTGYIAEATLTVAADDFYTVSINGAEVYADMNSNNYTEDGKDVYTDVGEYLNAGVNTISFTVTNKAISGSDAMGNPAGLLYRLEIDIDGETCEDVNTAPMIEGADSPLTIVVGETGDLTAIAQNGVTATDAEDGDITGDIIISGIDTIDITTTGMTTIAYSVDDSGNPDGNILSDMVEREVNVVANQEENTAPEISGADNVLVIVVGETGDLETIARDGVTATDAEDGDITGDIVIDGIASIDPTTVGSTTITYTVDDSGNPDGTILSDTVEREVRVVSEAKPQCSDEIDNDGDELIDADDPTCYRDGEYDPLLDNEENQKPVITLIQNTLTVILGNSFDPFGGHATANDEEDGDITADLEATGAVNTSAAGTYAVTYNVSDSEGLAADPKELTVIVEQPTVVSGGGGGGGGAFFRRVIDITDEAVEYIGGGTAVVTWKTNIPATSMVVYGDESVPTVGSAPDYGYDSKTKKYNELTKEHSVTIDGLTDGEQYWFRPISDETWSLKDIGREVTYTFTTGPAPVCNYLLEYIHIDHDNNPVEVRKLELFLNQFEGENLEVNGIYEQVDFEAVERFQEKYREDILGPWTHEAPTGYVYITTKKKINEIYCERAFPLTDLQVKEIEAFKALLASITNTAYADTGMTQESGTTVDDIDYGNTVGLGDDGTKDTSLADATDGTDSEQLADASNNAQGAESEGGILENIFGIFGGDDESDSENADTDETQMADADSQDSLDSEMSDETAQQSFAATAMSGIKNIATSYWFIFLLIVFAIVLFFRIRSTEQEHS
jgi:cysteine-rich repeat protein